MKNTVTLALAAFSVAGFFGASLAMADEPNALMAGAGMSRMFAAPANLPPLEGLPAAGSAKSAPLGFGATTSTNQSAFVTGSALTTPIISSSFLFGDNAQALVRAPDGLSLGGFAPIKSASAAKSGANEDFVSRAAKNASLLFSSPPAK
jgi:hypothetical protein